MENLGTSLWITVIGMGLVFIAIILLWGLMSFLVTITKDKEITAPDPDITTTGITQDETELKSKIAAAAVAAALNANKHSSYQGEHSAPSAAVSSWQSSFRQTPS